MITVTIYIEVFSKADYACLRLVLDLPVVPSLGDEFVLPGLGGFMITGRHWVHNGVELNAGLQLEQHDLPEGSDIDTELKYWTDRGWEKEKKSSTMAIDGDKIPMWAWWVMIAAAWAIAIVAFVAYHLMLKAWVLR